MAARTVMRGARRDVTARSLELYLTFKCKGIVAGLLGCRPPWAGSRACPRADREARAVRQMTPLRPNKYTVKMLPRTHPVQLPARKVVQLPHREAVDHRPRDGLHRRLHHLRAVLDGKPRAQSPGMRQSVAKGVGEGRGRRTFMTRELALLCSYARSALFTRGMFDTRESDFHSSLPSASAPAPCARSCPPSSSSVLDASARRSSPISDGDGSDGDDVPEVIDKAGVGWNAITQKPGDGEVHECGWNSGGCVIVRGAVSDT